MNWLKRNDLIAFFGLAFMLSWWPWALVARYPELGPIFPFGPMLAAFIVTALTQGWVGVKDLLRALVRWRVGARWYAAALLIPLGLWLTALYLNALLGAPAPTAAGFEGWPMLLVALVPNIVVGGVLGEEPGWRGFALPRLQAKSSPVVASLTLGVLWGLWHLPLLVSDASGLRAPIANFMTVVGLSFLLTWLYNGTKGSLLLVMLMHEAINTVGGLLLPSQMAPDLAQLWWLLAALCWAVGLMLVVRAALTRSVKVVVAPTAAG